MTQVLYAALAGPSTTSDLYTVDPVTAAMTSVGSIGDGISGMAEDPTDGTVYGTTNENTAANNEVLVTIDPLSGAETIIGPFLEGAFSVGFHEIAFDSTGQLWGLSNGSNGLYMIDKTTGASTNLNGDRIDGGAFDFDSTDVLWIVGAFVSGINGGNPIIGTIDTTTGLVTWTGTVPSDNNYIHSGKFDGSDLMWASWQGEARSTMGTDLITVDVSTGTVTEIAPFSTPSVGGLVWAGTAPPAGPFTLAASPSAFTRTPGASVTSTITSTLVSGSPENITISDDSGSHPTGVTVNIVPTTISDDGGTTSVTIHTTGATPLGTFSVSILGDDGGGNTAHAHINVHLVTTQPGFHIAS